MPSIEIRPVFIFALGGVIVRLRRTKGQPRRNYIQATPLDSNLGRKKSIRVPTIVSQTPQYFTTRH